MKNTTVFILLGVLVVSCSMFFHNPMTAKRFVAASSGKVFHKKSGYLFDPNDTSCDGFPMLPVETMPGTCLGMVLPREIARDAEKDADFIKPRTIVQIPETQEFLVLDMGGWKEDNGRLFWLKRKELNGTVPQDQDFQSNPYEVKLIKRGMNTPHGLVLGPDGFFYMGEKDKVVRFKVDGVNVLSWQVIVKSLPHFEGHMHPLTQFTFDEQGNLYLNSGAPSDHCFVQGDEGEGDYKNCPQSELEGMGAIYKIPAEELAKVPYENGSERAIKGVGKEWLLARGLRNSMAMVVHPQGYLFQGENARDFPEFEEPYEELNVIHLSNTHDGQGRTFHYGWPYCYNYRATSPEWYFEDSVMFGGVRTRFKIKDDIDCGNENKGLYQSPYALMPPHVAPLHMDIYRVKYTKVVSRTQIERVEAPARPKEIEGLKNHLIMSWHGHQPTGNRLVAYPLNEEGLPEIADTGGEYYFNVDSGPGCVTKNKFAPHGGMTRHSPYTEVISGWGKISGLRPEGAPVGFTIAADGSLWIVEDRSNRSILRLAKYEGVAFKDECQQQDSEFVDPKVQLLAWRDFMIENPKLQSDYNGIVKDLVKVSCQGCHGNMEVDDIDKGQFSTLDFLIKNEWLVPGKKEESKFYGAVKHLESFTPMPPAGEKDVTPLLGTPKGEAAIARLGQWIDSLPENVESRFEKVINDISGRRKVRNKPTTSGSVVCGAVEEADPLYVDTRDETKIVADGWEWHRLYMVPNHTRLEANTCEAPINGAYYYAVKRVN